jgi:hypothetical protein
MTHSLSFLRHFVVVVCLFPILGLAGNQECPEPRDDPFSAILGEWHTIDTHAAMGSLYQPVHAVRKRDGVVHFERVDGRPAGHAVVDGHAAISNQERWTDGRTDFHKVVFEEGTLRIEFPVEEWVASAAPFAVESGRLENKGTIRIEAKLTGNDLNGTWHMFLTDGTEIFRGEWTAHRAEPDGSGGACACVTPPSPPQ